jgi:hypothetical protein
MTWAVEDRVKALYLSYDIQSRYFPLILFPPCEFLLLLLLPYPVLGKVSRKYKEWIDFSIE